jgi:hypothetical protein
VRINKNVKEAVTVRRRLTRIELLDPRPPAKSNRSIGYAVQLLQLSGQISNISLYDSHHLQTLRARSLSPKRKKLFM